MKTIALFNHHPECSNECTLGMITALSPHYRVRVWDIADNLDYVLSQSDCVAFPGGIGDSDSYYEFFKRRHGNAIANFVDNGGKYLGICMGQYWAGSNYFDVLKGIDVVQYIKQPTAEIKRSYATVAKVTFGTTDSENMFFYDGCTFLSDIDRFDVVARYSNGDPMAMIQGSVGIIGCHPESESHWYHSKALKSAWHGYRHHHHGHWIAPALIGGLVVYSVMEPRVVHSQPVYVTPTPVVVAPPPPQPIQAQNLPPVWYYCQSNQTYYPYAAVCNEGWKIVPANPQ